MADSKLYFARHIAFSERVSSHITEKGCVPITVAFTHGLDNDDYISGIRQSLTIDEVKKAVTLIENKHNEKATSDEFTLQEVDPQLEERVSKTLINSDKAWIVYYCGDHEHIKGHMIGVLRKNDEQYLVCDVDSNEKYSVKSLSEIKNQIENKHTVKENKIYLFGFNSKI